MLNHMRALRRGLLRLHRCQRGAEGLEKLLIIAAVALPLLGVLIYFKSGIVDWVQQQWTSVTGAASNSQTTTPSTFTPPATGG
jgi:Flp pilus assembly pilin Flp